MLSELTACTEDHIDFSKSTVSDLLDQLNELHPNLKKVDFQIAIDKQIVGKDSIVKQAEIALLPPFSGG